MDSHMVSVVRFHSIVTWCLWQSSCHLCVFSFARSMAGICAPSLGFAYGELDPMLQETFLKRNGRKRHIGGFLGSMRAQNISMQRSKECQVTVMSRQTENQRRRGSLWREHL